MSASVVNCMATQNAIDIYTQLCRYRTIQFAELVVMDSTVSETQDSCTDRLLTRFIESHNHLQKHSHMQHICNLNAKYICFQ